MVCLREVSGLPISFDETKLELVFGPGLPAVKPAVRRLEEMRPVLAAPTIPEPKELYLMYRDVHLPNDAQQIRDMGLRYDISVFFPYKLGKEYMKTAGHYHPYVAHNPQVTFPEVYEVYYGSALFLLQKVNDVYADADEIEVEDCIALEVHAGQQAIMPPNYAHVTIIREEPLVMANWVAACFTSTYWSIDRCHGGAYYFFESKGRLKLQKNRAYRQVPPLRWMKPREHPTFGVRFGQPMYHLGLSAPEKLEYLRRPQKYIAALRPESLFKC